MSKNKKIISWIARLIVVAIFVMSALPKFTGDPMSVGIFETLGVDPWGRYLTGALEVTATILLLAPRTIGQGAVLAIVLMIGALGAHVAKLGFEGDLATAATMAVIALVSASTVATLHKDQIPVING